MKIGVIGPVEEGATRALQPVPQAPDPDSKEGPTKKSQAPAPIQTNVAPKPTPPVQKEAPKEAPKKSDEKEKKIEVETKSKSSAKSSIDLDSDPPQQQNVAPPTKGPSKPAKPTPGTQPGTGAFDPGGAKK